MRGRALGTAAGGVRVLMPPRGVVRFQIKDARRGSLEGTLALSPERGPRDWTELKNSVRLYRSVFIYSVLRGCYDVAHRANLFKKLVV